MLNAEVRQAVTELRTEMRDVRTAVEGITLAAQMPVPSAVPALSYEPATHDAQGPEASRSGATSPDPGMVATAPNYDALPAELFRATIPAQRDGNHTTSPDAPLCPSI